MREIKRNTQIQIYILWENLGEKGGGVFWAGVGLALGHCPKACGWASS